MVPFQDPVDTTSKALGAADCALLVALPLDRDAFVGDVNAARELDIRRARGDYALTVTNDSGSVDAAEAWERHGARVATLCKDLIVEARAAGARFIAEAADAEAFQRATRSGAKVIILVAHWKGSDILRRDLGPGVGERLRTIQEKPADAFEARLSSRLAALGYSTAGKISLALNSFIQLDADPADIRDELDRRLAAEIVPGGCVELRDGFHKPQDLADLIAPCWAGVIDLSVCHSIRLALALKQGRGDRLVLSNEAQKFPARCLRELRETFIHLSARGYDYLTLRRDIFVAYSRLLGEESRNA